MEIPRFVTGYSTKYRVALVLAAVVVYAAAFPFFPMTSGAGPGILVLIPLITAGGLLGLGVGAVAGLLSHPLNVFYGVILGNYQWDLLLEPGNICLWIGGIAIGAAMGFGANLAKRLRKSHQELRCAMAQIRRLEGLLPVCSHCKSIRDERGQWSAIDDYLTRQTDLQLSHGVCPDCLEQHYPEIFDRNRVVAKDY
jgi:hypothetical protein